MEGFSSNLNDTLTSTRGCAEPMFFPQHILPLLPLYNAQWWGYESLTAIVLVSHLDLKMLSYEMALTWNMVHFTMAYITSVFCSNTYGALVLIDLSTERLKWRLMPDKMAGKHLASVHNQWYKKIQSFDWPKWHCMLWGNINSHIFVGHRTSFQACSRYVNYAYHNLLVCDKD